MLRVGSVGAVLLAGVLLILGLRCFGINAIPEWFVGVLELGAAGCIVAGR